MSYTKKHKSKVIVSLFLAFILALSISSCGFDDDYSGDPVESRPPLNSADNTDSSEETEKSESMKRFDSLEAYDYMGRKFVIVTTDEEFFQKGSQSLVGKSVTERNQLIEGKFNISIEIRVVSPEKLLEDARTEIAKGNHYADLIVAPASVLATLMNEKLLLNLNVLPYLETDDKLYKDAQINGKTYLLFGSLTQTENSAWCMFYNEIASKSIGIDPYDLYKKGEWTWEAFLDFSQKVDAQYKSGFVSTATKEEFVNVLWGATGNKFFGDASDSPLKIPSVENGKAILSSIRKITESKSFGEETGTSALEAFVAGESGAILCRRNAVYKICDSKMDWKAVPLPSYDGESFAFIDEDTLAVSVPSNVQDSDFTGRILNAFVLATEATVNEAVAKNELYYYWDSNDTALMMDAVKSNLYLDIGIIYASAVKDIATVTTENIAHSLEAGISPFQFYHSTKRQFELYSAEYFG